MKVSEIKENPSVELVWWFAKAQEQFRISGKADMVFDPSHGVEEGDLGGGIDWEEKRREMFDQVRDVTRAAFAQPAPDTPLKGIDLKDWPEKLPKLNDAKGEEEVWVKMALKNCVLLIIEPDIVDYLELGVMPRRRTRFEWKKTGWEKMDLVP
jgi:pyridoxamine 5'-phosphate oxidase